MIQLKELLQLSPYLQTAQITSKNGSSITFPTLNIPLNKDTYFYIESTLSKLIQTCSSIKKGETVVMQTGKELTDINLKGLKYTNGNYVLEMPSDIEALNKIIATYSEQLKKAQESYRYLIA